MKGKPMDEITKVKSFKYARLVDYATERIDDGKFYPFDKILKSFMPNWIEGFEDDSPVGIGFYLTLGKKFRSLLRGHNIHSSVFRCKEYEYGYGYVAAFYSELFRERNKMKDRFDQNEEREAPGAVGKLTRKQLKDLDFK